MRESRSTSLRNVVCVARGVRPSGRCSALRRSASATCVSLAQRLRGERRRLDRHVRVGELLEIESVRAGGAYPAPRGVVAEDHRSAHPREAADRLAQPVVEVGARRVALGLREHLDEQLERLDADAVDGA